MALECHFNYQITSNLKSEFQRIEKLLHQAVHQSKCVEALIYQLQGG